MNLSISSINISRPLNRVAFKSSETDNAAKARQDFFYIANDSAETLQKKIEYMENRLKSEKDYLKNSVRGLREARRVKDTIDRLDCEISIFQKALLKLLTKKA